MKKKEKFITALAILTVLCILLGDKRIFIFINKVLGTSFLDFLFLEIFVPLFYILPATPLVGMFFKEYRKTSLFALFLGAFTYILASSLKLLFARPRPYEVLASARIVGSWKDLSFSFPSSTTALAFALVLPFHFTHDKKVFYVNLFLASSIAFFVIYSGYHWPSDAIAGIWLPFALLEIFNKLEKFFLRFNFFKLSLFNHRNA